MLPLIGPQKQQVSAGCFILVDKALIFTGLNKHSPSVGR